MRETEKLPAVEPERQQGALLLGAAKDMKNRAEISNKIEGSRWIMAKGKKTGGRKPGVPNKATRELKELAQPYAAKAIETLLWIMEHGQTEAARVAAVREVLDRGYGRPTGSGKGCLLRATLKRLLASQIFKLSMPINPTCAINGATLWRYWRNYAPVILKRPWRKMTKKAGSSTQPQ
jgi:hypothetical protein